MQAKGRIKGISGHTIMIEVNQIVEMPIDEEVDITIKKHSERRSLNANAYFHTLVDKLRTALKISFAECKNHLITSYGQIEYIEDVQMIYKTNAPPEYVRELEEIHMKLVKMSEDGAYMYRVYRGSHTYNIHEMALLIDGTIQECKEQGIETLTPNELARLKGYGY